MNSSAEFGVHHHGIYNDLEFFLKVKKDGGILPRLFVLVFPSVLSCMLPFSKFGCNFLEFVFVLPSTKIY
jgi:hypothetical protein